MVTSRMDPLRPRSGHYALVCEARSPILELDDKSHTLAPGALRNLRSGTPLGSSQVTAVVRRIPIPTPSRVEYPVLARARLVYPYLVRLTRSIPVPESCRADRVGLAAFSRLWDLFCSRGSRTKMSCSLYPVATRQASVPWCRRSLMPAVDRCRSCQLRRSAGLRATATGRCAALAVSH